MDRIFYRRRCQHAAGRDVEYFFRGASPPRFSTADGRNAAADAQTAAKVDTVELPFGQRAAIESLLKNAMRDTGQSRRVANFLLAWYNASGNGGWDPGDMRAVDAGIANDMMTVLGLIHRGPACKYPNDWGYREEIERVWDLWRRPKEAAEPEVFADQDNRCQWREDRR
jgi:hypothetical protein